MDHVSVLHIEELGTSLIWGDDLRSLVARAERVSDQRAVWVASRRAYTVPTALAGVIVAIAVSDGRPTWVRTAPGGLFSPVIVCRVCGKASHEGVDLSTARRVPCRFIAGEDCVACGPDADLLHPAHVCALSDAVIA